jgi:hypothetical protein
LRRWWSNMGSKLYTEANALLITADSGGTLLSATLCA